ncbi:hypothetical protein AMJ57_01995 [Parcubacteria bacterium SG8_24]|nr:MAG: hypothetical protein AMJ57_01995 [Parcubacteria bacterium SG8_24]
MRHFFILGSNPALSAAELLALLQGRNFTVSDVYKQALVVEMAEGIEPAALMDRLGGTVKIGRLYEDEMEISEEVLISHISQNLTDRAANNGGKVTFGLSVYALEQTKPASQAARIAGQMKKVGMEVKKRLKEKGIASRWVKPQTGHALSSVTVDKNKLIQEGAEFVILTKGDTMLLGETRIVQPFEQFSRLDYGRPARDEVQGMLPPKLARIMINITGVPVTATLMDPFCGSGTVLTEALQIGFTDLIGSDISEEAVKSTQANIDWISAKQLRGVERVSIDLKRRDARKLNQELAPGSVDAVVTEPYLGPPRSGRESRGEAQKALHELTGLYQEALASMHQVMKPEGILVLALPVYIVGLEKHGVSLKEIADLGFESESLLPSFILNRLGARETKNGGLQYGRNDQRVWREIIKLRLK